nr:hypothetical protein Iba_chr09aCG0240 [Ipomoea batatas]
MSLPPGQEFSGPEPLCTPGASDQPALSYRSLHKQPGRNQRFSPVLASPIYLCRDRERGEQ